MEGFQALVTIVPWNFVAQIANLLITMLLVKKFLFQRVQKILDQRQALCNAQLEEAASAREKAEQAQAQYEEALAQAKAEAGEIVKAARKFWRMPAVRPRPCWPRPKRTSPSSARRR